MIAPHVPLSIEGWRTDRLPDGGRVYRLGRQGYQIGSVFRVRAGWIATGPRVPHAAPFPSKAEAMRFCEAEG